MRARLLPMAGALLCLGAAFLCSRPWLHSRRHFALDEEPLLFPRSAVVRPLTFGHAPLAADLAWLEAIQYYGRHRRSDRQYPCIHTLFATLTGLDPQFESAYVFGDLLLTEEAGDPVGGRALLEEGLRANPQSWRLCFEYGFFSYLQARNSPAAAEYLTRASRLPGAPPAVARLAAYAADKAGERNLSLELWRQVLRSSANEEERRIARRYLRDLQAPEASTFTPEQIG